MVIYLHRDEVSADVLVSISVFMLHQSHSVTHSRFFWGGYHATNPGVRVKFAIVAPLLWFRVRESCYAWLSHSGCWRVYGTRKLISATAGVTDSHVRDVVYIIVPFEEGNTLPGTMSTPAIHHALIMSIPRISLRDY